MSLIICINITLKHAKQFDDVLQAIEKEDCHNIYVIDDPRC